MKKSPPPYSRPHWGPFAAILGTISIFFAAQFVVGIVIYAVLYAAGWNTERIDTWLGTGNTVTLGISLGVGVTSLVLMFLLMRHWCVSLKQIGLVAPRISDSGWALLGFGAYIVLYLGIVGVLTQLIPSLDTEQMQELGYAADETKQALVLMFFGLVVLPPLVEEILVRGFLFSGLRRKWPFWSAAVFSSLLFGLAHLPGGENGSTIWIAFVDTFILAMVLAYLRERTGSLWSSITLHAIKNFIAFMALFVFKLA